MHQPKVSVIVCNYNHNQYLEQSVNSLLNQTYSDLEIIIVDDHSDADPVDVISSIKDPRVKYIRLDKNYGKWKALNVGTENATGEIVTSHDADDVALKQRIERQLSCMINTESLHNLCGFYHCWSESDVEKYKNLKIDSNLTYIAPEKVNELVMTGFYQEGINHYFTSEFETAGCSGMFYKKIWERGIRFNPPGKGLRVLLSEDSDFNFRVTSLLGRTSVLAEKLYCYRRNTSTNSEEM